MHEVELLVPKELFYDLRQISTMQCNDSEENSVRVHDLTTLSGQCKESADFLNSIILNVLLQIHSASIMY